jgi:hypothetical protein
VVGSQLKTYTVSSCIEIMQKTSLDIAGVRCSEPGFVRSNPTIVVILVY